MLGAHSMLHNRGPKGVLCIHRPLGIDVCRFMLPMHRCFWTLALLTTSCGTELFRSLTAGSWRHAKLSRVWYMISNCKELGFYYRLDR